MKLVNFDSNREANYFKDSARKDLWVKRNETDDEEMKESDKQCSALNYSPEGKELEESEDANDLKEYNCEILLHVGCEMSKKMTEDEIANDEKIKDRFDIIGAWRKYKSQKKNPF